MWSGVGLPVKGFGPPDNTNALRTFIYKTQISRILVCPQPLLYYLLRSLPHQSPERECVLFIGTQFSNLYTAVDTPANGRITIPPAVIRRVPNYKGVF
jgi:hypothetical protein